MMNPSPSHHTEAITCVAIGDETYAEKWFSSNGRDGEMTRYRRARMFLYLTRGRGLTARAAQRVITFWNTRIRVFVTGSDDGTVKVWNATTGSCLITTEHVHYTAGMRVKRVQLLSPRVLMIGLATVHMWMGSKIDLTTGKAVDKNAIVSRGSYYASSVAFSSDLKTFVTSRSLGQTLAARRPFRPGNVELSFASSVDPMTPGHRLRLRCHDDLVNDVALSSKGMSSDVTRLVTASVDGTAKVFDLTRDFLDLKRANVYSGQMIEPPMTFVLKGHSGSVRGVDVTPDGLLVVTGGSDGAVKLWNAQTGELVRTLGPLTESIHRVAISRDGRCCVSVTSSNAVMVWDTENGTFTTVPAFRSGVATGLWIGDDDDCW